MMNDSIVDDYMDVLQNIEMTILSLYGKHPELTDHNVDKALDGLVRVFQAETRGKTPPTLKLTELERTLYEDVETICNIHLGRGKLEHEGEEIPIEAITVDEILLCLKRIRRSVGLWTKSYGIRGYLDFIARTLTGKGS